MPTLLPTLGSPFFSFTPRQTLKTVYSELPNYHKVIPALVEHGSGISRKMAALSPFIGSLARVAWLCAAASPGCTRTAH